jgi:hypothetical protein
MAFDASREDRDPYSCYFRFHTTNRCRKVARWVSTSGCHWCDEHADWYQKHEYGARLMTYSPPPRKTLDKDLT